MLTTIDKLKEAIGEKSDLDDVRLTRLLTASSDLIERYCSRVFASATYTAEMHDGSGTDVLTLLNWPIVSVSSLLEYGTSLVVGTDPSASPTPDALIYAAQGQLIRVAGIWHRARNYYSVTYIAGYATIPSEIVQATIDLASLMVREKDRIGEAAHTVGQNTVQLIRSLPEASQRALDLHRDLALGRAA